MTDFLEQVMRERRADAEALGAPPPRTASAPRSLAGAIEAARGRGELAVIAEVKRISPALGELDTRVDPARQASAYVAGGAAAISVLTEPRHWGGSLDDLRAVRAAVSVPVLCKDIITDERQLEHAHAAGADAVLLVAEACDDAWLRTLLAAARRLGLDVLVEAHGTVAFLRAVSSGARIVGANARDLRDPSVIDPARAQALHEHVLPEQLFVAESGIATAADVAALPERVDAILVGTVLMRAKDPSSAVSALARARSAAVR